MTSTSKSSHKVEERGRSEVMTEKPASPSEVSVSSHFHLTFSFLTILDLMSSYSITFDISTLGERLETGYRTWFAILIGRTRKE